MGRGTSIRAEVLGKSLHLPLGFVVNLEFLLKKKKKKTNQKLKILTETNRVLPRERTGHSKHPLPTMQEKTLHMDITRWSVPYQIDYILSAKDGEVLYSQPKKKKDQELTGAQIMNSLLPYSDLD